MYGGKRQELGRGNKMMGRLGGGWRRVQSVRIDAIDA